MDRDCPLRRDCQRPLRCDRHPRGDPRIGQLGPLVHIYDGFGPIAVKPAETRLLERQEDRAEIFDLGSPRPQLGADGIGASEAGSYFGLGHARQVALDEIGVHGGAS